MGKSRGKNTRKGMGLEILMPVSGTDWGQKIGNGGKTMAVLNISPRGWGLSLFFLQTEAGRSATRGALQ